MVEHLAWRLDLARAYVAPYAERAPIAVLGGSVAQSVADRWSDVDTIVYWDAIDRDWLETPRAAEGGERFTWVEHYPGNACLEQYRFGTVKADVAHVRLGWLDELIDGVLARTLDLVDEHLPDVDTARAREVWSLPAEPSDMPPTM